MENLRQGYWNYSIGAGRSRSVLVGDSLADFVVIGGGLSGLWAAHDAKEALPGSRVVLLERDYLGFGPSGRSGGIVYDFWNSLPRLSRHLGPAKARRLAAFSEKSLADIESLPGIEWQRGGVLHISTAPAYDQAAANLCQSLRAAGRDDLFRSLSPSEIRSRNKSPRWRGGTLYPNVATVHPGKLLRSLGQKAENIGVEIYEGSEVLEISKEGDSWRLQTTGGSISAANVLLATGAAGSLRSKSVVPSSSHMVVSEPIENIDDFWPGGEAITDERSTVRYMRKTADKRIAFGWGFGRADSEQDLRRGDPLSGEIVAAVFRQFFPQFSQNSLQYSWGGPIDISPTHLPLPQKLAPGLWTIAGYTGNGIGPSRTLGKILSSQILNLTNEATDLQLPRPRLPLPPGRLLLMAGNVTRSALLRLEKSLEEDRRPRRAARVIAGLPSKFGIELGR